jgi:hypothetical protein
MCNIGMCVCRRSYLQEKMPFRTDQAEPLYTQAGYTYIAYRHAWTVQSEEKSNMLLPI